MWTSEEEFDHTLITVMDETGRREDVCMRMYPEFIDIYQYNETLHKYDLITITNKQLFDLIEALKHPHGMFISEVKKNV